MRIADILAVKGPTVFTITGEHAIADAVAMLAERSIGALVVSPDGSSIDGIVSERDIVRALHGGPTALLDQMIASIMTNPVHTADVDVEVEELMAVMTEWRIRHVPVTRDGALAGLVSIGDVVKSTIEQLRLDRKLLEEYITAR